MYTSLKVRPFPSLPYKAYIVLFSANNTLLLFFHPFIAFPLSCPDTVLNQALMPKRESDFSEGFMPRDPHSPSLDSLARVKHNFTSSCSSSSRPCENVTTHSFIQNASLLSASLRFQFACLWDSDAFIKLMQTPGKFICPLISSTLMLPSISSDNQELTIHRTVGDYKST